MVPPFFGQSKPCCLLGNELALTKRERETERCSEFASFGGIFHVTAYDCEERKKKKKKLQKFFFVGDDIYVSHVIQKCT